MQLSTESKIKYLKSVTGKDYELTSQTEEKFVNGDGNILTYSFACEQNQLILGKIETSGVGGTSATRVQVGFIADGKSDFFINDNSIELGNGVVFEGLFQIVEGNTQSGTLAITGELFTQI